MGNIERLISEQVLTWAKREELAKKNLIKEEVWPVITISREYGARGKSLAKELNKRTGFNIWDKELLSAIAEEAGADERFMASLDERRRMMIDDFLHGFLMGSKHSNTHYFRSLLRVVRTIGEHGKSIIIGRGSNYIIKSKNAMRVRLVAAKEDRISRVMEREGSSKADAEKLVKSRDGDRFDFVNYHFKRDIGNPADYDLVLNSGIFNIEQMADLVLLGYEKKTGKPIPVVEQEVG